MPPHNIPALARVIRVDTRAWPLARLREVGEISEEGVVITWSEGQASALDSPTIAQEKDGGKIRVRNDRGEDIPHDLMFAFTFHAFWPEGEWMLFPSDERDDGLKSSTPRERGVFCQR